MRQAMGLWQMRAELELRRFGGQTQGLERQAVGLRQMRAELGRNLWRGGTQKWQAKRLWQMRAELRLWRLGGQMWAGLGRVPELWRRQKQ